MLVGFFLAKSQGWWDIRSGAESGAVAQDPWQWPHQCDHLRQPQLHSDGHSCRIRWWFSNTSRHAGPSAWNRGIYKFWLGVVSMFVQVLGQNMVLTVWKIRIGLKLAQGCLAVDQVFHGVCVSILVIQILMSFLVSLMPIYFARLWIEAKISK